MELTGKVLETKKESGTTQAGRDWVRYDVLVNHIEGDYPKNAKLSFNGEKFAPVMGTEGKVITAQFDINTRTVAGKRYTRLDAYRYKFDK